MPRAIISLDLSLQAPRKKKPVLLEVPVIVTRKGGRTPDRASREAGNDYRQEGPKSRIVQATKPIGRRKAVWVDAGQETRPEIKALIERMMPGRGPGT